MVSVLSRHRRFFSLVSLVVLAAGLQAEPLSRHTEIDFFRDVPSRNLKGLASRSDGRLVAGPVLTELTGPAPADLLWCLEPTGTNQWLIGTGPDGKIFEATLDSAKNTYTTKLVADLDEPHIFAIRRLADGALLVGTSPKGALFLIRDGKPVARVTLPVDSIFDVLPSDGANEMLVATGNPGRIYAVNLAQFAKAGLAPEKIIDAKKLAERGLRVWGEIRDRNVRRLARLSDGRVAAGSAPKGNLYTFDATGGAPVILQENRDAEVTDLLPQPNGDLFAAIVFASSQGPGRLNPPPKTKEKEKEESDSDQPPAIEKFTGRSSLVWFPANGFPEILTSRSGQSFYRLARHGDLIVVSGGEQGELLGYDLKARLALTFAGSASAQLNALVPLPGTAGRFLALRNNAPGLAVLDFTATGPRSADTRRLDLGVQGTLGALRFNRLRSLEPTQLALEARTSNGTDDLEGWSPWTALKFSEGGWRAADAQRGRYVQVRLKLADTANPASTAIQMDKATLYHLPQNRRPMLGDFRVFPPNLGLVPMPEPPPPTTATLAQLLSSSSGNGEKEKKKDSFLSSQVVPQPGTQLVLWTVNDPDNDELAFTFSIRRDGDTAWTDLAVNVREPYAQFDITHLPEGVYFTKLVATEQAPRPAADRLTTTFEIDDLVIDRTPPELLQASAERVGDKVIVTVRGRDALSLLEGIDITFNNGVKESVEQPADGLRDSREETFVLEIPLTKVSGATSVEVILYDAVGNSVARRLAL